MRSSLLTDNTGICSVVLGFILLLSAHKAMSFDAPLYFEMKCMSCHTIGGGDDVGPDLKGVTQRREEKWLIRFIQESQAMVNEGDPTAVELFEKYRRKKMPDQEIPAEDVKELLNYIKTGKASSGAKTFKSATKASEHDITQGRLYFTGEKALSKGGASCISCHSAGDAGLFGGGKLGPDLTLAYSNYNDKGLSKVLTKISFPSMLEVYKNKALTEQEVYQIKSFLYTTDKKGIQENGYSKKFAFVGIIGFLLLLGGFDLLWRKRRKNTKK